ncbi:hypothetical protein HP453_16735, partial [Glutamicibacter halophytocola]|nr:hypothetical protein [Glutamicibacter halophytocola]
MKKISAVSALAAIALLAGCSSANVETTSEPTEASQSVSPSPSSRISDGSTVMKISDFAEGLCTAANLTDTTYFKFYAECSTGQVAAEFADDADQQFVIEQLVKEREAEGNYNPWLVGEGWAFQTWADEVYEARKANPGSKVMMSPNSTMFVYDQMDLITKAIEKRSGAKCSIDEEYDLNAEIAYKCMKGKKDFYTEAAIYTRHKSAYLDEQLEKFSMIFKGAKREAYSVSTDNWYIHDVPKADAEWYAEEL